MILFKKQYKGKFILEVTIIKGYSDTEESINKLKNVINKLSPDKLIIERMNDEIFKKKLGISDERFYEISQILLNN
jgi:wyosine [tRNA(Phe)-imidazoG37] synthetase (radical SAM superfamily)